MSNCIRCGKAIMDDMLFCPYCGQAVLTEDAEHFESVKGEVVTAIISPSHVIGHDGLFAIAMTERHLIFAAIDDTPGDKLKGEMLQKGIFMPGSNQSANVSRFYEMTPEQVLSATPGNFQLDNDEVVAIKLSYDSDTVSYVATVRNGDEHIVFTMPYDKYYRDLLFRTFEGRMSW
jgi:hypothetical protein